MGNKWHEPYECSSLLPAEFPDLSTGRGSVGGAWQFLWVEEANLLVWKSQQLELAELSTKQERAVEKREFQGSADVPRVQNSTWMQGHHLRLEKEPSEMIKENNETGLSLFSTARVKNLIIHEHRAGYSKRVRRS